MYIPALARLTIMVTMYRVHLQTHVIPVRMAFGPNITCLYVESTCHSDKNDTSLYLWPQGEQKKEIITRGIPFYSLCNYHTKGFDSVWSQRTVYACIRRNRYTVRQAG